MARFALIALGVAALASAPPRIAHAQTPTASDPYNASRYSVEPYLSQTWSKNDVSNKREGLGGFGARVMFGQSRASRALSTLFNRARGGAFVTYGNGNGFTQVHYGVEGDFPLFSTPSSAGFRLDPFVSLGLGAIHTSVDAGAGRNLTSNDFALTPAIGTLIPIAGAIAFRGDLRDAVLFGNKTTNNFIAEGGISIGF